MISEYAIILFADLQLKDRIIYSNQTIMAGNQSPDNQPNKSNLEEIRATRIAKIGQIKELGLNPYAYKWEITHHAQELQEKYLDLANGEEVEDTVAIFFL